MSKDALHQLIHSLSTFEKGYYIKSKGDSHLTTLFNAMNKLEVYDKATLEKRLNKHPEILRYLAKYKNDTYTDIMRVMRSYRQEKEPSVDVRLRMYLTDITFLIERGLYENAMKLIRDAKKLATKYEKYKVLLEILDYEIDLSMHLYKNNHIETIYALIEVKKKIMSILNKKERYRELLLLIFYSYYTKTPYNIESQSHLKHLNELMSHELLTNENQATSFITQYYYYSIHYYYCRLVSDMRGAYNYQKKIMNCWDAYPHMKDINFLSYTASINNYLIGCSDFEEHTFFEHLVEQLKKELKPKNSHEEAIVFQRLNYVELGHYHRKSDFDKLDQLITDIQPLLEKYSKAMPRQRVSSFKIMISVFLFLMNRYEEAYKGFSDIIKQKLPIRVDIQCVAWVFKLIIAYEQGYENFANLHRAAQRFFNKIPQEEAINVYLIFMKFLHQVMRSPLSDIKTLFVQYQAVLQDLYDNDMITAIGLEEILIWMEHVITKQSMVEIHKKQVTAAALDKVS